MQTGDGGATSSGKLAGKTPLEHKKHKISLPLPDAQNKNNIQITMNKTVNRLVWGCFCPFESVSRLDEATMICSVIAEHR